ncbi:L-aspartate oxidase [Candidatus Woesearchaeota archaeon CG_4_10_14_0_2_um_filter_57_5]|nr:MAG: L-aspartate oxidase [Candidatus Woesearchaeota archaeon CG_4_10_14_0_2_um_filter_57_5]
MVLLHHSISSAGAVAWKAAGTCHATTIIAKGEFLTIMSPQGVKPRPGSIERSAQVNAPYLVIGSGIAGDRAALELADRGADVTLITKGRMDECNSDLAQGGISAVSPEAVAAGLDSYRSHVEDTLRAGDGSCNPDVVEMFVRRAYGDVIGYLEHQGVAFDRKDGVYVLHQEGGHSVPRVYPVADYTGHAVQMSLEDHIRAHPNITVLEHHAAIDLITENTAQGKTCCGAYVLDREIGRVRTFAAGNTIIATGGAGRVYQVTSNQSTITGDGIVMAFDAGASVLNLDKTQFHPTVYFDPGANANRRFLMTEALRGEAVGGVLALTPESTEDLVSVIVPGHSSHSTRDIVARAIYTAMQQEHSKGNPISNVWLNLTTAVTGKSREQLEQEFPTIFRFCLEQGIDISEQSAPVVPAAHYTCGGVPVNIHGGSAITGLYVIGECAYTGLMGANRLASNSLPEGALYGLLAATDALSHPRRPRDSLRPWRYTHATQEIDEAARNTLWDSTRHIATNLVGIERSGPRLQAAQHAMRGLHLAALDLYWDSIMSNETLELRNATLAGYLMATAALQCEESRGGHFRTDFPQKDDKPIVTYVSKDLHGIPYQPRRH